MSVSVSVYHVYFLSLCLSVVAFIWGKLLAHLQIQMDSTTFIHLSPSLSLSPSIIYTFSFFVCLFLLAYGANLSTFALLISAPKSDRQIRSSFDSIDDRKKTFVKACNGHTVERPNIPLPAYTWGVMTNKRRHFRHIGLTHLVITFTSYKFYRLRH
jgi:hypothetical protein